MSNHYDSNGYYTGRSDSNGNHYDSNGYYTGWSDSNGNHYNNNDYYTGYSGLVGSIQATRCSNASLLSMDIDCNSVFVLKKIKIQGGKNNSIKHRLEVLGVYYFHKNYYCVPVDAITGE